MSFFIVEYSSAQKRYFIGYTTDSVIRYSSSSGGVGTAIIKYLLESGVFGTAMTFVFDNNQSRYYPKLIFNYSEYNNCGSIYQDTDNIGFIKENINRIENGIVVTCMPCQVLPIKNILSKNRIKHFIISLCCSGQTTVQGTWFYYKLLGIKKEDVVHLQYRGNGWPSGIQIQLKNGDVIKKGNYTYPWTLMHESLLFRPKRCLSCIIKTSSEADISLADPWLQEYIEKDKVGNSVLICNLIGESVINRMCDEGLLRLKEVNEFTFFKSQNGTIETKAHSNEYKSYNKILGRMGDDGSAYKRFATMSSFSMRLHMVFLRLLRFFLKHKNY